MSNNRDADPFDQPSDATRNYSPFDAPGPDPAASSEVNSGPSVFDEPWMRADREVFQAPAESLGGLQQAGSSPDAENSVWDEPGLSKELAGDVPQDAITWFAWYQDQVIRTSAAKSWLVTAAIAFVSGICAIGGALILQPSLQGSFVLAVIAAPITEEIMKIALAIWVVEKCPWLFKSSVQILVCGLAAGLAFAAIENLVYLHIYIDDPPASLVRWRWTICVLLHTGCSVIASLGVVKIWQQFQIHKRLPALVDGATWLTVAMCVHGAYNLSAIVMEGLDVQF